jgi:hypothetical protein
MVSTICPTWGVGSNTSSANTTQFWCAFGAWSTNTGGTNPTTTELQAQVLLRSAGVLSGMTVVLTANTTTTLTVKSRLSGSNGNQIISISGSGTVGSFSDTTNVDTISGGQKTCITTIPSATGTFTISNNSFIFAATTNTVSRTSSNGSFGGSSSGGGNTFFDPLAGDCNTGGYASVTTGVKARQQKAGTMHNICMNAYGGTGGGTFSSNLAGAAGAQSVSVTGIGFFEDTTHTDTITVGSDFNLEVTTGSMGWGSTAVDFISTLGDGLICNATTTPTTVLKNVTTYYGLGGSTTTSTTETNVDQSCGVSFIWSGLTILVTTNTASATSTLTLRANAVSQSVVASITASTTGIFADTTHTYVSKPTDLMDTQLFVGNAGTSLIFANIMLWASYNPLHSISLLENVATWSAVTGSTS